MAIDFAKLQENAKKTFQNNTKKNEAKEKDTRFYEAERNKDGNFNAVIRFLHSDEKNEMPFVKVVNHYFTEKDPRGKDFSFIQYCPTDVGEKCPICEYNRENWNDYTVEQQNRKRKSRFYTNILVISDEHHPEREGKVFLFSYGIKVHEKIMKMIAPDTSKNKNAKAYNIFDYKKGKNFILNITTKAGFANYDDCEWDEASEIENVDDQIISLEEFIPKKDKFKSYEEIDTRFKKFLAMISGKKFSVVEPKSSVKEDVSGQNNEEVWPEETSTESPSNSTNTKKAEETKPTTDIDFFDFEKD